MEIKMCIKTLETKVLKLEKDVQSINNILEQQNQKIEGLIEKNKLTKIKNARNEFFFYTVLFFLVLFWFIVFII